MEKKSDNEDTNRAAGIDTINREAVYADVVMYTDGSAKSGNTLGGAGIIVTTEGTAEDPRVESQTSMPAGYFTSSFQAEMTAAHAALQAIVNRPHVQKAVIVTDSLSTLEKMKSLNATNKPRSKIEYDIMSELHRMRETHPGATLTVVWCPSHCGIPGNDMADSKASEGGNMPQLDTSWTHDTAKAAIKRHLNEPAIQHPRLARMYSNIINGNNNEDKGINRQQQVTLSRLRSGHHQDLRYWQHKVGREESDLCRLCGGASETSEHVLTECPAMHTERRSLAVFHQAEDALGIWHRWRRKCGLDE